MDDPVVRKEIQNLIDGNIGDTKRLEFILKSLEEKKIYNSDKKYLLDLLDKYSKDSSISERLENITKSKSKKPTLKKDQKYCAVCAKVVYPERDFNTGALLILLVLGIIPGLIYYAVKNKTCPICKHDKWESNKS